MGKLTALIASLALACGLAFGQTESQEPSTSGTQAAAKAEAPSSTTPQPSVMAVNIQHWKGTLVDANCAASGGDQSSQSKKSASCTVTSSTTMFAIQTSAGQVLKFDAVGNMRAAEELKNNKKWSKEIGASKPIHTSVSGNLAGDTVTVTSIH